MLMKTMMHEDEKDDSEEEVTEGDDDHHHEHCSGLRRKDFAAMMEKPLCHLTRFLLILTSNVDKSISI